MRFEVLAEREVATVLDITLRNAAKIASLNPVQMSLEDYFLAQVVNPLEAHNDKEGPTISKAGQTGQ